MWEEKGMERRKSVRYNGLSDLMGKLYNVVNFHVKNISKDGINIVSHFQPNIGSSYVIYINNEGQIQDFHIRVIRRSTRSIRARAAPIRGGCDIRSEPYSIRSTRPGKNSSGR